MNDAITGIHHITAIATDPQRNLDFYAGALGLRLVKKTVNFDDPGTYHLYYGEDLGRPGTILTFFPWPMARRGSRGSGQATVTSFSIPAGSLGYWVDRLERLGIVAAEPESRFDEQSLAFYDPDGLKLEFVAHEGGDRGSFWDGASVPGEHAIRGFHSVTLAERNLDRTLPLLVETMGFEVAAEASDRVRLEGATLAPGGRVDLLHCPGTGAGQIAAGTVHHVAWRVPDDVAQATWRERLLEKGFQPTPVLDRQYFKSIYFHEPGGILFELATDPPGFSRDEPADSLGTTLKLPPWLEPHRKQIENTLPPLSTLVGAS